MIAGFEWACAGTTDVWCIRRVGADRMLCGRSYFTKDGAPGYCPTPQPIDPRPKCQHCLDSMYGRRPDRAEDPVVFGVCPVCERWEPVADGLMQAHGGWAVGHGGMHETGEPCAGVGMAPEVER